MKPHLGIIQFHDPVPRGGGCNVCTKYPAPDPVAELEMGSTQSTSLIRLCSEHLKELRLAVIEAHVKYIIIPGAEQRRKDGGLT